MTVRIAIFGRRWVRWSLLICCAVSGVAAVALVIYGGVLSASLALPKSDEHPPLLIYGAPHLLKPGEPVAEMRLFRKCFRPDRSESSGGLC